MSPSPSTTAASLLLGCSLLGCTHKPVVMSALGFQPAPPAVAPAAPGESGPQRFEVGPPPFTEGIFPCTECHDPELPVNGKRRKLSQAHQEIVLKHDEEHRWCLDCHDASDRDSLHLASGQRVPFTESYRLCGQCHGDKYRDWRAGVHGRRTGSWSGDKAYLLCVNCHNAHSPHFQPIQPKPAPRQPGAAR